METVRAPELLKAPPLPVVLAPEIVTAETVKLALEPTLKILKLRASFPLSPLMVSVVEPGPVMLKEPLFAMVGNALSAKVITPVPPVKSDESNTMSSFATVPLAVVMASRSDTPVCTKASERVVTVIVAGVILDSKSKSSSLRNLLLPEVFFVKSRLKILPIIKSRLKILRKNFNDIAQKPFKSFKLANNA